MSESIDPRELVQDLGRLIRGELTSVEVKRLVSREGFRSFSDLCETRLPEDLSRVRIGTRDVLARIDRWRKKQIDLFELWFWADELYNIAFNHRIAYEPRGEELVMTALSAISVIANERLFPSGAKTERSLEIIRACLLRRRKLRVRNIFIRVFEDLEVAHLANKHGADGGHIELARGTAGPEAAEGETPADAERWADIVLLDGPYDREKDIFTSYNWMIAFTVTARSLYEEERAEDAAADSIGGDAHEALCPECARKRRRSKAAGAGDAGVTDERDAAEPRAAPPEGNESPERGPRAEPEAAGGPALPEPFKFAIPGWSDDDDDDEDESAEAVPLEPARRIRPTPREPGEEIDRVPALRRLVPNFDFDRLKPRYLYDGDGIAEIVLDTPRIGPAEIRYATRLFCIANRIRSARLHDEPIKTLVVKPGAGRRVKES